MAALAALTVATAVAGCRSSGDPYIPNSVLQEMGDELYRAANFYDASQKFARILERTPGDFKALVGIANCYRELGTDHYLRATELERMGKLDGARKEAELGHQFHTSSYAALAQAAERKRDDPQVLYGLGLLHYHRASGAYRLFAGDEAAEIDRCAREAARYFEAVRAKEPNLPGVRRYLGNAYFRAMEFDKALPHLEEHRAYVARLREQLQSWTPKEPEEMERRRRGLTDLEAELGDLDSLIGFSRDPPARPSGEGAVPASLPRLREQSIRSRPLPDGGGPGAPASAPGGSPPR